jgi:DNA-binding transcriptional regulator YiaG
MEVQNVYSDQAPRAANDEVARNGGLRSTPITPAANRRIQERLGRAIRLRRRMMDLTLQDIANACGVTFQQVHKYESGLCSLSAAQLWCIATVLQAPISYFYDSLAAQELLGGAAKD